MRVSFEEQREKLAKQKAQIEARLKQLDARAKTEARKLDTRRKVIVCRFRLKAARVSDAKAASILIASRPAFRFEGGHHSDMKPATLPL